MKRYTNSLSFMLAIMAGFWAFTIMRSLIEEFVSGLTYIDLGAIFVLGLISGLAVGVGMGYHPQQGSR